MSVLLYSKKIWGVCQCGHYDWQHSDFVYGSDGSEIIGTSDGTGKCGHDEDIKNPFADGCSCEQFTWVKSVPAIYLAVCDEGESTEFTPDYEPEEVVDGKLRKFTINQEEKK